MIKKMIFTIFVFLHNEAMAFAWHRPGHKDGEDKPGNNVPEIDAGDALLIGAIIFCACLLYIHWRRSRDASEKE